MFSRFASLGPVSGSAGTTYSATTAPSTPKLVLSFGSDNVQTPTTDDVGTSRMRTHFGAAVSTSNRAVVAIKTNNGQAAGVCNTVICTDVLYERLNGTVAALQLGVDLSSFNADGETLIIDRTGGFGANVATLMIGGAEVTATIVAFDEPGGTGAQNITEASFGTPDVVIFIWAPDPDALTPGTPVATTASIGIGAAARYDGEQALWAGVSVNGADPSITASYCRMDSAIAGFAASAGSVNAEAAVTNWITDGVEVTWSEVSGVARHYYAVLIKGIRGSVKSFMTEDDTSTDIVLSSVGFQALGGLLFSACKAEDSAGALSAEHQDSIGCFDDAVTQFAVGSRDENGLATTSVQGCSLYGEVYANMSTSDTVQGSMNVTAIGADSVTMRMTDADPAPAFGWALLLGNTPSGVVNISGGGDFFRRRM